MSFIYRFAIEALDVTFSAPGHLEKSQGCYVVVAEIPLDQAALLQKHASVDTPVSVFVDVDGQAVGVMQAQRIAAKERRGSVIQIWALVHVPSIFAEAMRT